MRVLLFICRYGCCYYYHHCHNHGKCLNLYFTVVVVIIVIFIIFIIFFIYILDIELCVVACTEKENEDEGDDEEVGDGGYMSGSSDGSISHNSFKRKGIGKMNTPNKDKDKGEGEGGRGGGRGGGDRGDTAPHRNGSGEKCSPQTEGEGYSGKDGRSNEWEERGRRGEPGSFSFSAAKVTFLLKFLHMYLLHAILLFCFPF